MSECVCVVCVWGVCVCVFVFPAILAGVHPDVTVMVDMALKINYLSLLQGFALM